MKKYRWAALATVLMCTMALASVVVAETEQAEEAPKGFWVEKAHVDLDPVVAGVDAVAIYVFHNDTDKEVKIIKAKPS